MIDRIVDLPNSSFFLLGPRQTGKSTLIDQRFKTDIWKIDLLLSEDFFAYSKDPALFRKQAEEKIKNQGVKTIFIDEI